MRELVQLEKDFQRGRWLLIAAFGFSLVVALTAVVMAFRYSNEFSKRILDLQHLTGDGF